MKLYKMTKKTKVVNFISTIIFSIVFLIFSLGFLAMFVDSGFTNPIFIAIWLVLTFGLIIALFLPRECYYEIEGTVFRFYRGKKLKNEINLLNSKLEYGVNGKNYHFFMLNEGGKKNSFYTGSLGRDQFNSLVEDLRVINYQSTAYEKKITQDFT